MGGGAPLSGASVAVESGCDMGRRSIEARRLFFGERVHVNVGRDSRGCHVGAMWCSHGVVKSNLRKCFGMRRSVCGRYSGRTTKETPSQAVTTKGSERHCNDSDMQRNDKEVHARSEADSTRRMACEQAGLEGEGSGWVPRMLGDILHGRMDAESKKWKPARDSASGCIALANLSWCRGRWSAGGVDVREKKTIEKGEWER